MNDKNDNNYTQPVQSGKFSNFPESGDSRRKKMTATAERMLAVIGALALILLGVWGMVQLPRVTTDALTAAVTNLTSVFIPAEETPVEFDVSSYVIDAGVPFTLAWRHEPTETGSYLFRYACREGVAFEIQNDEEQGMALPCNTAFDLGSERSVTFTASSKETRFSDVPVTVSFLPGDTREPAEESSILLTIVDKGAETSLLNGEPADSQETTPAGGVTRGTERIETRIIESSGDGSPEILTSDPSGTPDLSVTVLAVGTVDKITNVFTPSTAVGTDDRAGIQFEIRNIGTKESGPWSFIVDIPLTTGVYVFRPGDAQQSLFPGERIEYTLGFDGISRATSSAEAVVNVDPARAVQETNRANNTAAAAITVETN